MIRVTIALRYRSGAEVQVAERALDNAAVISGDLLQALLTAAVDRRESVEIHHGKTELVIRIADRSYEPMPAEKRPPPRPKYVLPTGEF